MGSTPTLNTFKGVDIFGGAGARRCKSFDTKRLRQSTEIPKKSLSFFIYPFIYFVFSNEIGLLLT